MSGRIPDNNNDDDDVYDDYYGDADDNKTMTVMI